MFTPFPPIPEDITRYILEAAAELIMDESTGLRVSRTLVLVSKVVKAWIDPILHRVVFLRTESRMVAFGLGRTNFTQIGVKSGNIKRKVRRLGLLNMRCDPQTTCKVFEVIEPTALHEIFIHRTHFHAFSSPRFPPRPEGDLQPRRLITSYLQFSNFAEFPVGGLLARVTHLRLGLYQNTPQPSTLRKLSL